MSERRNFIRTMGAIAAGAISIEGMNNFAIAKEIEDASLRT